MWMSVKSSHCDLIRFYCTCQSKNTGFTVDHKEPRVYYLIHLLFLLFKPPEIHKHKTTQHSEKDWFTWNDLISTSINLKGVFLSPGSEQQETTQSGNPPGSHDLWRGPHVKTKSITQGGKRTPAGFLQFFNVDSYSVISSSFPRKTNSEVCK